LHVFQTGFFPPSCLTFVFRRNVFSLFFFSPSIFFFFRRFSSQLRAAGLSFFLQEVFLPPTSLFYRSNSYPPPSSPLFFFPSSFSPLTSLLPLVLYLSYSLYSLLFSLSWFSPTFPTNISPSSSNAFTTSALSTEAALSKKSGPGPERNSASEVPGLSRFREMIQFIQ